jgi:histone deacetylase complex regulatory component SIN3
VLIHGFSQFLPPGYSHLLSEDQAKAKIGEQGQALEGTNPSVPSLPPTSMEDRIINGNNIAADIRAELKAEVEQLKAQGYAAPGLAVILVGDRTDSATYVRMKEKACQDVGFNSSIIRFPGTATQDEIVAKRTLFFACELSRHSFPLYRF